MNAVVCELGGILCYLMGVFYCLFQTGGGLDKGTLWHVAPDYLFGLVLFVTFTLYFALWQDTRSQLMIRVFSGCNNNIFII